MSLEFSKRINLTHQDDWILNALYLEKNWSGNLEIPDGIRNRKPLSTLSNTPWRSPNLTNWILHHSSKPRSSDSLVRQAHNHTVFCQKRLSVFVDRRRQRRHLALHIDLINRQGDRPQARPTLSPPYFMTIYGIGYKIVRAVHNKTRIKQRSAV